ncbi:MAG: hypothetical protein ABI577_04970 [bacterium]
MTVYSGTYSPVRPDGTKIAFRDPIADAREKLRQAARLPFHASKPHSWQDSFLQLVTDARADLRRHIWLASLKDSPLNRAEAEEPRLKTQVESQRKEHDVFAEQIDELVTVSSDEEPADIWRMIELGERSILLEMALARHHNRLMQLLFETTHRDVGIAG